MGSSQSVNQRPVIRPVIIQNQENQGPSWTERIKRWFSDLITRVILFFAWRSATNAVQAATENNENAGLTAKQIHDRDVERRRNEALARAKADLDKKATNPWNEPEC